MQQPTKRSVVAVTSTVLVTLVALNLLLYAVAGALGVEFEAPGFGSDERDPIPVGAVLAASIVAPVLGGLVLAVLHRFGRTGWLVAAVGGLLFGLASGPWFVDIETNLRLTLGAMHVLGGLVWAGVVWSRAPHAGPASVPGEALGERLGG